MRMRISKWWVAVALLVIGLSGGCRQPVPTTMVGPAKPGWDAFVNDYLEGYFAINPTFAVLQGRHDFDGKLPDWSEAGLGRAVEWLEQKRTEVLVYSDTTLDARQRFERDYLVMRIRGQLFGADGG
jgi:hypothetical protein